MCYTATAKLLEEIGGGRRTMTEQTAQAIDDIGEKLREYTWGLYGTQIRQEAIPETENH